MYKCTEKFSFGKQDKDGVLIYGEYIVVEENSIWYKRTEDCRFISEEIRLENDEHDCIEISRGMLNCFFELIKPNEINISKKKEECINENL